MSAGSGLGPASSATRHDDGQHGLSWQIVPTAFGEMLGDEDPAKADQAMRAMLEMGKLDIAALRRAYEGQ